MMNSYSQTVLIKGSPQQVFQAIAQHVQDWWGNTDAPVSTIGDEFTTSFANTHWTFRISAFVPHTSIIWECIDAKHIHAGYEGIEKEWLGTSVVWTLEATENDQTLLHFTHDGLTADLTCYEICTPAWDMFVPKSLKSFVETGKGMPSLS